MVAIGTDCSFRLPLAFPHLPRSQIPDPSKSESVRVSPTFENHFEPPRPGTMQSQKGGERGGNTKFGTITGTRLLVVFYVPPLRRSAFSAPLRLSGV